MTSLRASYRQTSVDTKTYEVQTMLERLKISSITTRQKPKYVSTRSTSRARRDERVKPCLLQHGRRRKSSSAHAYMFSLSHSGFTSISGTASGKSEVDMAKVVWYALS